LKDFSASNFYAEAYESDIDYLGFGGPSSMLVEERPILPHIEQNGYRGTRFTVDKVGRFVVHENGWLEIDEEYREFKLDAMAAVSRFGKDNIPDSVEAAYHKQDYTTQFKFIHGVYPRPQNEKTYGNKKMPWASCYAEYATKEIVQESGYEEYPFLNPRWTRVPGEAYGRGLGEIALNDLITLNTAKKMSFEDWSLKIKPPILQAHDAVIGSLRLKPWGVTTVRLGGRAIGDLIQPFQTGSHPEISQIKEEELRRSIRQAFYVDQLRELLMIEGRKEMTAFEYLQKINLLNKILGPVYGRWESEFGNPLIARHFNLLYRRGVFSPPPDILVEQGGRIKVQFESPLARAQRMEEIQAMNQAMSEIAPIAEMQWKEAQITGRPVTQPILDGYDFDKYREHINKIHGVPATVTRSAKEVAVIRNSRAEAEQQAKAGQEAMMVAEGAGKVAPLLKVLQGGREARA